MTITVAIPAHNEEDYIAACLEHCLMYKTPNVCEVLVINNASTDRTHSIAEQFPGVTVVDESRKGVTYARQKALESATGDLLAFVDADTHVPEGWFEMINAHFAKDSNLVCLSGPYYCFDLARWQNILVKLFWMFIAFPMYCCTRYMVIGGNFVAKRSALLRIGGFDTSISFYGEDTNIARRLHKIGRVQFNLKFITKSSGRRMTSDEGFWRTSFLYAVNFVSEVILRRPVTRQYRDIR